MTQERRYNSRTSELAFRPTWGHVHELETQLRNARHVAQVGIACAFVVGILLGLCFGGWVIPGIAGLR